MLKNPSSKYQRFVGVSLPDRQWPNNFIQKPPIWMSTDLRDGNQALIDPMSVQTKFRMFKELVKIGFKEIEIGFPSASEIDFNFARLLIEENHIPDDVTIEVLVQARYDLIEKTVQKLNRTANLRAWLGPAIGPRAFEVGPEVRRAFVDQHSGAASCFVQGQGDRWFADLYGLARQRLAALGISAVSGGEHCTFSAAQDFHSFRRDGAVSGRMATLIWRR